MKRNKKILKHGFVIPLILSIIIGICALFEIQPKIWLPLMLCFLVGMYFQSTL